MAQEAKKPYYMDMKNPEHRDLYRALLGFQIAAREKDLYTPVGGKDTTVRFIIAPGQGPQQIAQGLFDHGLISDPELFLKYLAYIGKMEGLAPGCHKLKATMCIAEIAYSLAGTKYNPWKAPPFFSRLRSAISSYWRNWWTPDGSDDDEF